MTKNLFNYENKNRNTDKTINRRKQTTKEKVKSRQYIYIFYFNNNSNTIFYMKKKDMGVNTLGFKEVSRTDDRLKDGIDTIIKTFNKEDKDMGTAGKIYNEEKFRQQLLFDGISDDKRTGTDGDWIYESKKDRLFIMAEVKEYGKEVTIGQKILIKNLVENMGGVYRTYGFVLWHKTASDKDILLKDTIVKEVYFKDKSGKVVEANQLEKNILFRDAFDLLKLC